MSAITSKHAFNLDGNPIADSHANLVLSDEDSPSHQPDADFVAQYAQMYDRVCAVSVRAAADASDFLDGLNAVITKLGGKSKACDARS